MKGFTSVKELNLGLTCTHLIISKAYRRFKKKYCIKSDLAFRHWIKYQIVCLSGYSRALLPHWIIYRSVCACSNETQQPYKLQPLHCANRQEDPSLKVALSHSVLKLSTVQLAYLYKYKASLSKFLFAFKWMISVLMCIDNVPLGYQCMSAESLRFVLWSLAHPSCQTSIENVWSEFSMDFITNHPPFSCDTTSKQLLWNAVKSPREGDMKWLSD